MKTLLVLALAMGCTSISSEPITPRLLPPGYDSYFAQTHFALPENTWEPSIPMPVCERHSELHGTGYFTPLAELYNLRIVLFQGVVDVARVEDPERDEWGYYESGPIRILNWSEWTWLFLIARLGTSAQDPLPVRLELRFGETLDLWAAAPYEEVSLTPDNFGGPFGGEGALDFFPSAGLPGPYFSFRVWLQDDGTMGNYVRSLATRWQRAYIPATDFFETHDCGPDMASQGIE